MKIRTRKLTRNTRRKPNPLRVDPSRTAGLRRQFIADLRRRFGHLRLAVVRLIADEDALGLKARHGSPFTHNTRWLFNSVSEKVKAFQGWLADQTKALVSTATDVWTRYVQEGFRKGQGRAFDDVKRSDVSKAHGAEDLAFYAGTRDQFLRSAFGRPVAVDKVKMLAGRLLTDLKGVTDAMATTMSRVLTDGLVQGKNPRDIARDLSKAVDISQARAFAIAQTELIRVHAAAQLETMRQLGIEHVGAAVEFSSAKDSRVCPSCEALDGVVLTLDEAEGMIPVHVNCIVGESVVESDDVLAVLKTHYTGEIVELVTANGRRLAVTANHILLTEYGFVPARLVYEGLNIVDAATFSGPATTTPNDNSNKSCIADVFAALAEDPLMLSKQVPTSPEDLHGDGRSCDSEVHIVWPHGKLRDDVESGKIVESPLVSLHGVCAEKSLPVDGSLAKLLERMARTADGSMGRFRELLALLLGRVLHAKKHGLPAVSPLDASVLKSLVNGAAAAPKLFRKCLCAHPILKQLDNLLFGEGDTIQAGVIHDILAGSNQAILDGCTLEIQPLADGEGGKPGLVKGDHLFDEAVSLATTHVKNLPVYDVQTQSTLYRVNGLVTSNCRCCWTPANVGESSEGQKRSKASIDRAVKRSVAAAGRTKDEEAPGWGPGQPISKTRPTSILNELTPELMAFSVWVSNNCGIGSGGFEPGNTCAKGGNAFDQPGGSSHRTMRDLHRAVLGGTPDRPDTPAFQDPFRVGVEKDLLQLAGPRGEALFMPRHANAMSLVAGEKYEATVLRLPSGSILLQSDNPKFSGPDPKERAWVKITADTPVGEREYRLRTAIGAPVSKVMRAVYAAQDRQARDAAREARRAKKSVTNADGNCGIGSQGFEPGNTCAKGGSGGESKAGGFLSRLFGKKEAAPQATAPAVTSTHDLEGRMRNSKDYQAEKVKVAAAHEPVYHQLAGKLGKSVEETKQLIAEKAQKLADEAQVYTRIFEGELHAVLDSGRWKTQHETGSSRGSFDPKLRAKVENKTMAAGPETAPEHRPVSTYLSAPNHGIPESQDRTEKYGDIRVRFKDSVRDRATVTFEDSLSAGTNSNTIASPLNKISHLSVSPHEPNYHGIQALDSVASFTKGKPYIETQVHGGLHVKDIAHVELPHDAKEGIRHKLTQHGISWHMRDKSE